MKSFEELNPGFKCDLCLGQKKKKKGKNDRRRCSSVLDALMGHLSLHTAESFVWNS